MKKTIVTITGIRPDFIRMKAVFEQLDKNFNHVMVHTGQHYADELSQIFFKELTIRKPDYSLETGVSSTTHYEQLAYLSTAIIELFKKKKINPDVVMFLGDSNSALASIPLHKEGYKIAHIEGGMRSYDRRMPEETNRVICDYCSEWVFVYTPLYKQRLIAENKDPKKIFVVGNTIVEPVREYLPKGERSRDFIVADIHRNENLCTKEQYLHMLTYLNATGKKLNLPVKLVRFNRATKIVSDSEMKKFKWVKRVGPYGFLEFLNLQYQSYAVISDSGTAQEECPLLGVPVTVPRNFTERPESVLNGNSILVGETDPVEKMTKKTISFLKSYQVSPAKVKWLGNGLTSKRIVDILKQQL